MVKVLMGSVRGRWLALALTSMLGCSQSGDGDVIDESDASVDASFVEEAAAPAASPEARAVVSRLTSALDALRAAPPPQDLAPSEPLPSIEPQSDAVRLVRRGAWLSVEVEEAQKQAELRLPLDAKEAFRIADPQTGLAVFVSLRGAQESKAEIVGDDVVYRRAAPGFGDVVHRPSAMGTEDFVLYEQKPAEEKLA